jgi:chromodomain-helicase-DNA-binding protein 1
MRSYDSFRFKVDDTQLNENLAKMDLDDILNQAEEHETVGAANAGGSSLGGEGFLNQMATISDVKADLSWDEIIPLEDRQRLEEEEVREAAEAELAAKDATGRKRAAAMVQPGAYEGMDAVEAPAPPPPAKKAKNPAPTRKTAAQRAVELKERDLRVLVRSLQRWGDIRLRYGEIVSLNLQFNDMI